MHDQTFAWSETRIRLGELLEVTRLRFAVDGRSLAGDGVDVRLPALVAPPAFADAPTEADFDAFLAQLDEPPGLHFVVLLRAGATALGVWRDDASLAHKAFKHYVVRGSGKAQRTHLATKGKSRYGSRLRLQNAQRQLDRTLERLHEWRQQFGPPRRVFVGAPTRLWSDLTQTRPGLPFDEDRIHKIAFHVHTPTFAELERVRRRLGRGRIEHRSEPGSEAPADTKKSC